VFEQFTERARQVVVLAQEEARALRHNYIGTEHILLGLLREEEGLAARVLESLDITVEEVRAQVARIVGQGEEVTTGQIPFTPRAKKVLELALREGLSLGHKYIGTEHVLLGLLREGEGVAVRILLNFDADADKIRSKVLHLLGGSVGERYSEPAFPAFARIRGMPRRVAEYAPHRPTGLLLLGWSLFAAAMGIGILIGWAIWA
jgi:ATP-dependent Clp protease ATP-binding subunit ClpC